MSLVLSSCIDTWCSLNGICLLYLAFSFSVGSLCIKAIERLYQEGLHGCLSRTPILNHDQPFFWHSVSSSSQEMHYPFSWLMCQELSFSLFSCLLGFVCSLCGFKNSFCPAYYSLEKAEQQFSTALLTKALYVTCTFLLGKGYWSFHFD